MKIEIDLPIPDEYEVVEGVPRAPKENEYYYNMRMSTVSQCTSDWALESGVAVILRKRAPVYNVMDGYKGRYIEIKALEDALSLAVVDDDGDICATYNALREIVG